MRAGQAGGQRNSQSRDVRQGIQVRSVAAAANPKPFLASSLKSGVVPLAFSAQSISSFEWKALPVNGKAVVGRQGNILGAASILSAIVPVFVVARAAAGFGLPLFTVLVGGRRNAQSAIRVSPGVVFRFEFISGKGFWIVLLCVCRNGCRIQSNERSVHNAQLAELLEEFEKRSEAGQIVEVSEIKAKYEKAVGHKIGSGQIYEVPARHGWRKVMPRSRHPKKADKEVIETSKKLTFA